MTMKRSLPLAALAATLALAACGGNSSNTSAGNDAAANVTAPAPKLLMIKASKIYRCKDNSVAYVDFMSDDQTANLKTTKDGKPTVLKAEKAGDPFKDGETSLTGNGDQVTLALPGKGSQSCKSNGHS